MPEIASSRENPLDIYDRLKETYLRYYDSAYELRDQGLMAERREAVEERGRLFLEPLLEPVARYQNDFDLTTLDGHGGLDLATIDALYKGLFQPFERSIDDPAWVRSHQGASLLTALSNGPQRHPVVTAGTGSGKTEAFLLPVLARICLESRRWKDPNADTDPRWWRDINGLTDWRSQRSAEIRPAAIRAIFLYPTNALVEDQVVRLRKALDPAGPISGTLGKNKLYFGRYTSATPGLGDPPVGRQKAKQASRNSSAEVLRHSDRIWNTVEEQISKGELPEEVRYEFQRPDSEEMMMRWDMQTHAPDILITNYSMLNVMLLRDREENMFADTRAWLDSCKDNVLTLVVDELHTYRGTPGTEVALMVRKLLDRLGLGPDSEQVRCIATSASLEGAEQSAAEFCAGFFSQPQEAFHIITGKPVPLSSPKTLDLSAYRSLVEDGVHETSARDALISRIEEDDAVEAITSSCSEDGKTSRATPVSQVCAALFDQDGEGSDELRAILEALPDSDVDERTFRVHMFMRVIKGIWACSDPDCTEVEERFKSDYRSIGRIYTSPRYTCNCGSRILELLYCLHCGEPYLGGFTTGDAPDEGPWLLFPKEAEGAAQQSGLVNHRAYGQYMWYWPHRSSDTDKAWTHTIPGEGKSISFRFGLARLDPKRGHLARGTIQNATGTMLISGVTGSSDLRLPALPEKCPSCGSQSLNSDRLDSFFKGAVQTPIGRSGGGVNRTTQVALDSLTRDLGDETADRKTIVFSDSRDDSARGTSGISLNHYRNTIRQCLFHVLRSTEPLPVLLRRSAKGLELDDEGQLQVDAFKNAYPDIWAAYAIEAVVGHNGLPEDQGKLLAEYESSIGEGYGALDWTELIRRAERWFVQNGMNPAGTGPTRQSFRVGESSRDWWAAYTHVIGDLPNPVPETQSGEFLRGQRRILSAQMGDSIFAFSGRDFESIGLGWVEPSSSNPLVFGALESQISEQRINSLIRSSLRILGQKGLRVPRDAKNSYSNSNIPPALTEFLNEEARISGLEPTQLQNGLIEILTSHRCVDSEYRVVLDNVRLVLRDSGSDELLECVRCSTRHLDPDQLVCVRQYCNGSVFTKRKIEDSEDYYAWLGTRPGRRLNAAELTGQTSLEDQKARQRRFKGVVIGEESSRFSELDLLGVTTTMEVGVDIGPLRSVVMANMPPKRFNYQQRVGRAGRRGQPFSYSLTICKDRGHDDYYFVNQERITGDAPPPPYLDLSRLTILKRSAASEVLRKAFLDIPDGNERPRRTRHSLHGNFGAKSQWQSTYRSVVSAWINKNVLEVEAVIGLLTSHTGIGDTDRVSLVEWINMELVTEIDEALDDPVNHHSELSLLLANAGLLPMFGFPSKVRSLYNREVRNLNDQGVSVVADRGLSLAVSMYSPGKETVKDGSIHRAIGFAEWDFVGGKAISIDPLAGPVNLTVCGSCGSVEPLDDGRSVGMCEICREPVRHLPMYQPLGFRTNYQRPEDYDDDWQDSMSSSQVQIALTRPPRDNIQIGVCAVETHEQGAVFTINDNFGNQFEMDRMRDRSVLVRDPGLYPKSYQIPSWDAESSFTGAIGSISTTDITTIELLGLDDVGYQGVIPSSRSLLPAGAAAMKSLAHAFRRETCRHLDVEFEELVVGVQPIRRQNVQTRRIYLADSLDNGAGYASVLASQGDFEEILEGLRSARARFVSESHSSVCDRACPDCLMSYDNRADHPLLDWRLAVDMIDLVTQNTMDPSFWMDRSVPLINSFIDKFGDPDLELITIEGSPALSVGSGVERRVAIFGHPLWVTDTGGFNETMADLYLASTEWLSGNGGQTEGMVYTYDLWTLETSPETIYDGLYRP